MQKRGEEAQELKEERNKEEKKKRRKEMKKCTGRRRMDRACQPAHAPTDSLCCRLI